MKLLLLTLGLFLMRSELLFAQQQELTVKELAPLPDSTGFAGSFAGVVDGKLVVAGGSNFPDGGAPWNGSQKVWYNKVFLLDHENGNWKKLGVMPRSLGYGVSITVPGGLICIGGSNESGHYADVFLLQLVKGQLRVQSLPSLPVPLANTCGALVGKVIYVAGGITTPTAATTENAFYALDISKGFKKARWTKLPAWPGPSRMLSAAAATGNAFYLFGGARLVDGKRIYLKDAYRFSASEGWKKIAGLPGPSVAAATPLIAEKGQIFLLGGDDGALAGKDLRLAHPGFSKMLRSYDIKKDCWYGQGDLHVAGKEFLVPVTTSLVQWNGQWILPGGEIRPGVRTPKVYAISLGSAVKK
ncbi:Kelch repeat-containing protein [Niabella hirudinis]|uniref:Kelch repeat-containing protein n=1 Tax=Niabella hirudinis TaxID=1285929 RepID=UPI003EBF3A42